ncbi:MAG: response regulator transcription factor [Pseudomonadota bacterium]
MNLRLLLVDDHAIIREGLRHLLGRESFIEVVGEAATGRQALALVEELQPDMVVMDIAMPDMNGIEATEEICRRWPKVRVVILSVHSTTEHIHRAFRAGATGYVLKESAGKELIAAVRSAHSNKTYLSQKIREQDIDNLQARSWSKSPLEELSRREREVLQLVVEGKSSIEIAAILFLSQKTVETYRSRLMSKLALHDIPSLVKFAIQHGITPLE